MPQQHASHNSPKKIFQKSDRQEQQQQEENKPQQHEKIYGPIWETMLQVPPSSSAPKMGAVFEFLEWVLTL